MTTEKKLLVIGKVWPEPDSSAAGSRMLQLLKGFKLHGWDITFSSASAKNEYSADLSKQNIREKPIRLNHNSFNTFIENLQPNAVLFDRFMTEEQFGWRVAESCPDALKILDTEDLHSLRKSRQNAIEQGVEWHHKDLKALDVAKRELASIYRCDLTLMISEAEMNILTIHFELDRKLIHYIPFLYPQITEKQIGEWPSFEERSNFVTIGNFLHTPNKDSVYFLKSDIWPLIRKELPNAKMNIYGAYVSSNIQYLNDESSGFFIKGRAKSAAEVLKSARVCLAPLRFGAGLKGKLAESMQLGTPTGTTTIGAEGMNGALDWPGFIEDNPQKFAEGAISLYTDKYKWQKAQMNGADIINQRFNAENFYPELFEKITALSNHLESHRRENFIGSMLMHHTTGASRYMSKWIEEKNK